MEIQTSHFGIVEIDDNKILTFESGIPGLEEYKRFALISNEDSKPVCWLQSVDCMQVSLPVVDPFVVCKDYSFDISDEDSKLLAIDQVNDVYILCILVIPRDSEEITINLAAPIVINVQNSKACQIILDDKRYRVRIPITELLNNAEKNG